MQRINQIQFRAALPDEAGRLGDLALRSKAHWGYSEAFLDACRAELSYSPGQIADTSFDFVVAMVDEAVAGFYALRNLTAGKFELEALFVEPACIGQEIGRASLEHAKLNVVQRGGRSIDIQGDPHADGFYRAAGGKLIGYRNSESIPGRKLPLFAIHV